MTRGQRAGTWGRRSLLTVGVVLLLGGVVWVSLPLVAGREAIGLLGVIGFSSESAAVYAAVLLVYLGLFFCTQWMFLRPRKQWTMRQTLAGRPMKRSILAAALIASLLSVGAIATVLEIPNWWRFVITTNGDVKSAVDSSDSSLPQQVPTPQSTSSSTAPDDAQFRVWPGLLAIGIAWAVWVFLFWRYWKAGDRYTQLTRMIRGLLVGSILEVFVATAVHAFTYRRDDCYCCRGSYTGLVFGGTVLLWVFGPGIVLLYKREKYRQRLLVPVCLECGYDLRGITADKCPECGEAIPREIVQRMAGSVRRDALG